MDMQGRAAVDGRHFLDERIPAVGLLTPYLHGDCLTEHLKDRAVTRANDTLAVDIGCSPQEATRHANHQE